MRIRVVVAVTFWGIFGIHFLGQFWAWAYADAVKGGDNLLWNILSIPLIPVFSASAETHFEVLMALNSVLWSILLTVIVARLYIKANRNSNNQEKTSKDK